jgi:hypothetical protein
MIRLYIIKELRMSAEIRDYLPLIVIAPSQESSLQKKVSAHLPSRGLQDSVPPGNRIEPEFNAHWERGTLIDIYV